MEIYPAVDLYEGKVVRLERGDYQKITVYGEDPAGVARKWVENGARWLHVVDLEGARDGKIKNWKAIEKILKMGNVSIQFGGGVRTEKEVARLFELGVKRAVLGTKALDFTFLRKVSDLHGDRLAISFDLRGDEIQIEGWLKGAGRSVFDFLPELGEIKLSCIIVTDIQKDGVLEGVNLGIVRGLLQKSPYPVIASGGVSSLDDLWALKKIPESDRLNGVIIGKALYENRFDLREAVQIGRET